MSFTTWGCAHLVDAHGPAQDDAERIGLPVTVFYHPDHAHSHTNTCATILKDRKTKMFVTWLPSRYFYCWCQCESPEPALVEHGLYSQCEKCGLYIGTATARKLRYG